MRYCNEQAFRSQFEFLMQMDCLRCKTPELVRKEIWTHALAYNLIRTIMAQAASRHAMEPRSISFKGTLQTLEAFQPMIAVQGQSNSTTRQQFYEQLLVAVAAHRLADRPDRFDPRRHKHYVPLAVPRQEANSKYSNGLRKTKRHSAMQPMRLNEKSVRYDKGWFPALANLSANDLEPCEPLPRVASRTHYTNVDSNGSLSVRRCSSAHA